ncbi:uncharacterized protein [Porites lutea]|uniref:uncharacterized protein n=1 Tax=Porites lutea TaxID=51062 RepID=UPI003CC56B9C
MALFSNFLSQPSLAKISEGEGNGSSEDDKGRMKHRFSEPWEDSDLILVVEDEKFHVHRLIMSMNSPVFKAMFKSQFKEATANEILLPEKKASEILDLLKRVYSKQFIEEPVEIIEENVEHLLKLSDEYQIKHIFDACINFVETHPKTKQNVMKLRKMATNYNLDRVRDECDNLLKNLKLTTLSEIVDLKGLDQETLQYFLEQRIKRLETVLDKVYPEFMGMVECLIWLMYTSDKVHPRWCVEHVTEGCLKHDFQIDSEEIRQCFNCRNMFHSMESKTRLNMRKGGFYNYHYGNYHSYHFDFLQDAIVELSKLKHEG